MLKALATRLLTLPIVLAVATLVLMAPFVATPTYAFEIEKQDWDGYETLPDELPEEYLDTLACAEAGDSECQVQMAWIWAGSVDPDIWNPNEYGRWSRAAAAQGHRRGMHEYTGYLCAYFPNEPANMARYAIEAIGWQRLFEDAVGREPRDISIGCGVVFLIKDGRPNDYDAILKAGEKRAEELRRKVPRPYHGVFKRRNI